MGKYLALVNIGGGYGIKADKTMVNIDADIVLVAVVVDAISAIRQPTSLDLFVLIADIALLLLLFEKASPTQRLNSCWRTSILNRIRGSILLRPALLLSIAIVEKWTE
jgi:hypothetical protein